MSNKYKVVKISKQQNPISRNADPILLKVTLRDVEEFSKIDAALVEVFDTNMNDVKTALKDADIIFLGSIPITRSIIESAPKCLAIMCRSVGYDNIDVAAATENKVLVVNNPSFEWCAEEVSNHAMALLLACAKKIKLLDSLVIQGRWAEAKKAQSPMGSIYGQTLGIVGCGAIGRMMARKAQAFGMKVIGYDPYIAHPYLAKENGISLTGLKEVLGCDYISIHADLNGTSQHMINDSAFQQMKPSAYLINTSRGKIIDESALIKALLEKRIAGAGLDVFEIEPLPQNSPLTTMDNVIMLPHSASYSDHSFDIAPVNIAQEAARILHGQWPKNVVNQSVIPKIQLVKAI